MAQRRPAKRTAKKPPAKTGRIPFSMAFWILFFIVLISLFFILLPRVVKKGITHYLPTPQEQPVQEQPSKEQDSQSKPPAEKPKEKTPDKPPAKPPATQQKQQEKPPAKPPAEKPPAKPPEQPAAQPKTQQPATPPAAPPASQPEKKPPETRDRSVYFMRESGADLTPAKVNRKLAVSDSPLIDCVNALLTGPSAEEKNNGIISFIPPNTRLLSARVVNNTVHLNFNEAFRYNTSGREGSAAQLQQIVWTATEFPNVNNVQIEIEGKIVDFLVEGIMIRNPIGR